jgi:hypothetical protein
MEDDITPKARPGSPKGPSTSEPSEGELSRIAREAVRQPPDPRLEKQLAWMGLGDGAAPTERQAATVHPADPQPTQPMSLPVAIATDLEPVRAQLRRIEQLVWVIAAVTAILAVLVLVLLLR